MSKKRILIVEDDLGIQTLTKFCLEMDDSWAVILADNGEEGLFKALTLSPDVILLDLILPDLSEIEILDRLSYNQHTANIPIVLFTAKLLNGEIIKHEDSNVVGIISKPYNSLTLSADIHNILKSVGANCRLPLQEALSTNH